MPQMGAVLFSVLQQGLGAEFTAGRPICHAICYARPPSAICYALPGNGRPVLTARNNVPPECKEAWGWVWTWLSKSMALTLAGIAYALASSIVLRCLVLRSDMLLCQAPANNPRS